MLGFHGSYLAVVTRSLRENLETKQTKNLRMKNVKPEQNKLTKNVKRIGLGRRQGV